MGAASSVSSVSTDHAALPAEALLLGLALEDECRAARLLAHCGIDPAAIGRRWPELREHADASVPAACGRRQLARASIAVKF